MKLFFITDSPEEKQFNNIELERNIENNIQDDLPPIFHSEPNQQPQINNHKNNQTLDVIQNEISANFNPDLSIFNECDISFSRDVEFPLEMQKIHEEGFYPMCLHPDSFKIVLIIDTSEPDYLLNMIKSTGLNCEKKRLNVGDFIWVARPSDDSGDESNCFNLSLILCQFLMALFLSLFILAIIKGVLRKKHIYELNSPNIIIE